MHHPTNHSPRHRGVYLRDVPQPGRGAHRRTFLSRLAALVTW